jgi:hypothetical protein
MLAVQQCTLALARIHQLVHLELVGEPARYVCGCLPAGFGPSMRVRLMGTRTGPAAGRHALFAAD